MNRLETHPTHGACPKCGATRGFLDNPLSAQPSLTNVRYCQGPWPPRFECEHREAGEHLYIRCNNCNYEKPFPCADAPRSFNLTGTGSALKPIPEQRRFFKVPVEPLTNQPLFAATGPPVPVAYEDLKKGDICYALNPGDDWVTDPISGERFFEITGANPDHPGILMAKAIHVRTKA